jgi:hypothetical protein
MKIKVTREDINLGRPNSSYFCPLAYAVGRLFHDCRVIVGSSEINLFILRDGVEFPNKAFKLPLKAKEFIKKFDNEEYVEPFEFELSDGIS